MSVERVVESSPDARTRSVSRVVAVAFGVVAVAALVAVGNGLYNRYEAGRLSDERGEFDLATRDAVVLDLVTNPRHIHASEMPDSDEVVLARYSDDLRPGAPERVADILPQEALAHLETLETVDDAERYVLDADAFYDADPEGYGEWLGHADLVPTEPMAAVVFPELPDLGRGEIAIAFTRVGDRGDGGDDDAIGQIVIVGDDPPFSHAGAPAH